MVIRYINSRGLTMLMIIGITGAMGSGKTSFCDILKAKGFQYLSLSDTLREIAKDRSIEPTRENLRELGSALKKEQEKGYLAKLVKAKISSDNVIIDGIRTPDEVSELQTLPGFQLWAVTADEHLRFRRMKTRGRSGDPMNFSSFEHMDDIENKGSSLGQQIEATMALAKHVINNNGSKEELEKCINSLFRLST